VENDLSLVMREKEFFAWLPLPCVRLKEEGGFELVPAPTGKPGRHGYQELCRFLYGAPSWSEKEKAAMAKKAA
jgi:hypothetical protein